MGSRATSPVRNHELIARPVLTKPGIDVVGFIASRYVKEIFKYSTSRPIRTVMGILEYELNMSLAKAEESVSFRVRIDYLPELQLDFVVGFSHQFMDGRHVFECVCSKGEDVHYRVESMEFAPIGLSEEITKRLLSNNRFAEHIVSGSITDLDIVLRGVFGNLIYSAFIHMPLPLIPGVPPYPQMEMNDKVFHESRTSDRQDDA